MLVFSFYRDFVNLYTVSYTEAIYLIKTKKKRTLIYKIRNKSSKAQINNSFISHFSFISQLFVSFDNTQHFLKPNCASTRDEKILKILKW